jgi:hypothetical protein
VATFFGPMFIDPPTAPPRPYGLFDVALGPMPFPVEAAVGGGVQYIPDTCENNVYLYDMACPAVSGSKTFDVLDTSISGSPFAVITSFLCGSVGISMEEVRQRVMTRMQLHEQRAVERRVWQGQTLAQGQGAMTGLFRNATNVGPAGCVTEAVELLEQALADNGIVGGMIHARPGMAAHLEQAHQIQYANNGRRLQTCLGTPYVFGQGYDGSGPTGQPADGSTEWMYASGRVLVWQDTEIAVPNLDQVFRRSSNERIALAERVYAVVVECGVWTTQVTRTCTTTGVPT